MELGSLQSNTSLAGQNAIESGTTAEQIFCCIVIFKYFNKTVVETKLVPRNCILCNKNILGQSLELLCISYIDSYSQ